MRTCTKCGTELSPDARFCPACGTANVIFVDRTRPAAPRVPPKKTQTTQPGSAFAPPRAKRSAPWWIVPLVILGLIIVGLFVTSRSPEDKGKIANSDVERVQERVPAETGTLVPVDETPAGTTPFGDPTASIAIPTQSVPAQPTGTPAPSAAPATAPPSRVQAPAPVVRPQQPAPAPQRVPQVAQARPAPRPATQAPSARPAAPAPVTPPPMTSSRQTPAPAPPAQSAPPPVDAQRVTSDAEAVTIARRYIVRNDFYDTHPDCLSVRSVGYVNVGYTLEAWDTCPSRGGTRRIGVWRVDALTGEVFRQRSDGRFLRP